VSSALLLDVAAVSVGDAGTDRSAHLRADRSAQVNAGRDVDGDPAPDRRSNADADTNAQSDADTGGDGTESRSRRCGPVRIDGDDRHGGVDLASLPHLIAARTLR
jgi:hypothetical protein